MRLYTVKNIDTLTCSDSFCLEKGAFRSSYFIYGFLLQCYKNFEKYRNISKMKINFLYMKKNNQNKISRKTPALYTTRILNDAFTYTSAAVCGAHQTVAHPANDEKRV